MRRTCWMSLAGLLVLLTAAAGCSFMGRGAHLPVPKDVIFLFTGDTAGELQGCG